MGQVWVAVCIFDAAFRYKNIDWEYGYFTMFVAAGHVAYLAYLADIPLK